MTDLDPRGLEAAARVIAHQNSEILGHESWGELEDEQRDCLHSEAAEIITAYLAVTQPTVETMEGLEELPVGTIILDRFEDESYTRIVGPRWVSWVEQDGLRHTEVALPARVLCRPHENP